MEKPPEPPWFLTNREVEISSTVDRDRRPFRIGDRGMASQSLWGTTSACASIRLSAEKPNSKLYETFLPYLFPFASTSDGLQPTSNGIQPKSDGLQPKSDGLQPKGQLGTCAEEFGWACNVAGPENSNAIGV